MKNVFCIFIGKLAILLGKLVRRGSVFPGNVVKKLNKDILSYFKLPKLVIAVTGSSGKGSISSDITKVFRQMGYKVAYNDKGSNIDSAIITMLLENSTLSGKIKTDVIVYEMDERYAKFVMPKIVPNFVVITNITRDQPPRQGHYDIVYNEILKSLKTDAHLIINGDDPYLMKLTLENKFKLTYYGVIKNKYSYLKNKFDILNIERCPKCSGKLMYNYYNFETYGDYKCTLCSFKRPISNYEVTKFNNNEIIINNKYKISLGNDLLYNVYNSLATFATLSLCGLNQEQVAKILSSDKKEIAYSYNNKKVYVLNNKAENASTYNQSLIFCEKQKGLKTVVIGWKEISRRYEFNDISWLYDINFKSLNSKDLEKVICIGPQKYDIATCLKINQIPKEKILIANDFNELNKILDKNKGDIFAILNFDYVKPFNEMLRGNKK